MFYVAVSGTEIIFTDSSRKSLESKIDEICAAIPDLFRREYITIMTYAEYLKERF